MALKDLSGKAVYDLEKEDFEKLFCHQCRDCGICVKDPNTIHICMGLIDSGVWECHFRKRHD
ncbi:hypothetical protein ES703_111287 [subsurface metagenome]